MPSKTETAARRLVAEIYRRIAGRPMRWVELREVSQQAGADAEAVHLAALRGWIELASKDDPHSVTLTDAGRQVAAPTRPVAARPTRRRRPR